MKKNKKFDLLNNYSIMDLIMSVDQSKISLREEDKEVNGVIVPYYIWEIDNAVVPVVHDKISSIGISGAMMIPDIDFLNERYSEKLEAKGYYNYFDGDMTISIGKRKILVKYLYPNDLWEIHEALYEGK